MTSGNYPKARGYFRRAHELRPDDNTLALDYGRALTSMKDYSEARALLEKSIKANAKQPGAQILLGKVYFGLNRRSAALDQIASAVLSDAGNTTVIAEAARILIEAREYQRALDILEPIASPSADRELLGLLAQSYRGVGRTKDASRADLQAKQAEKSD
jgi:predicted Zn-dependent protease